MTSNLTQLTLADILGMDLINSTDSDKVAEIAESIKSNGWIGAPLLVHVGINQLVTGSHRLAALQLLAESDESIYDMCVAVDVSELVDAALMQSEGFLAYNMVDYSDIGWMFEGTDVEQWKSEIEEW